MTSRYVYVIEAKDKNGHTKHLTVTSPYRYNLGRKDTKRRKILYGVARDSYATYDFDIRYMHLVSTWDALKGKEVRF